VSVADTQNNIAGVLEAQGKFEEALELYQKSLNTKIQAVGPSHVSVAMTYGNIGNIYNRLGQLEKALEMHQKDLEIKLKTVGPSHVSVADTKYNIALAQIKQGNKANAQNSFQEAGLIYSQIYGAEHRMTVQALEQAKRAGGTSSGCCRLS
jgi:tetratricopeptide (TPR) repeat protein